MTAIQDTDREAAEAQAFREQCRRQMARPIATRMKYGFCRVNREWFGGSGRVKAGQEPRTPRRYRVHHALENFRQVLDCARPCGAFREIQFDREPCERREWLGN